MKKEICIVLSVFILAGCTSHQTLQRTVADDVGLTHEVMQQYTSNTTWWKEYYDPELNHLIDIALKNNIDLAKTSLNIKKAMARAGLAATDQIPIPYAVADASTKKNLKHGGSYVQSYTNEIGLNYELDFLHRLGDITDAKRWEYQASVFDKEALRLALVNNVIDSYFRLAYLKDAIVAIEANEANYGKIYNIAYSKYSTGKTDKVDMLQARQSMTQAENMLIDFETQIKNEEQTLRNLLNLKPTDALQIKTPKILTVKTLDVDLNVPLSVLAGRPDLKASEARLQEAFISLKAEKKSWYPTISLKGAIETSSGKARTAFDAPFLMGAVTLDLPFLNWNTVRDNIRISKADYEIALLDFEQNINKSLNEVAFYYQAYMNSQKIFDGIKRKHSDDVMITEYYKVRYETGRNDILDLLIVTGVENTSKLDLLNNRYQIIKYENMIFKAMAARYELRN